MHYKIKCQLNMNVHVHVLYMYFTCTLHVHVLYIQCILYMYMYFTYNVYFTCTVPSNLILHMILEGTKVWKFQVVTIIIVIQIICTICLQTITSLHFGDLKNSIDNLWHTHVVLEALSI